MNSSSVKINKLIVIALNVSKIMKMIPNQLFSTVGMFAAKNAPNLVGLKHSFVICAQQKSLQNSRLLTLYCST